MSDSRRRSDFRATLEMDQSLGRMVNRAKVGEGTSLAPKQVGQYRVFPPPGFHLGQTRKLTGGTEFTLVWNDVDIDNIYYIVQGYEMVNTGDVKRSVVTQNVKNSPARCFVGGDERGRPIMFRIQTITQNGIVSDEELSSTAVGRTL